MSRKVFLRYVKIWFKLSVNSFLGALVSRFGAVVFLTGKFMRFVFFTIFLMAIFQRIPLLAGYTLWEAGAFYLTFSLIDTVTQLLFREVYRFRQLVITGELDFVLVKPMSPLFRVLLGGADPFDFGMGLLYAGLLGYLAMQIPTVNAATLALFAVFFIVSLGIAAGFHIFVLSLAILTTEIDHTLFIYRDLTSMARIPIDVYQEPVRSILTFVIPIGLMVTFPAKALMGYLQTGWVWVAMTIAIVFLGISIRTWNHAVKKYTSASS